jgi:hypothetical protein
MSVKAGYLQTVPSYGKYSINADGTGDTQHTKRSSDAESLIRLREALDCGDVNGARMLCD